MRKSYGTHEKRSRCLCASHGAFSWLCCKCCDHICLSVFPATCAKKFSYSMHGTKLSGNNTFFCFWQHRSSLVVQFLHTNCMHANKQMYIKATITHIGQSKPGLWQYRLNSLLWYNAWPEKQATLVWENRFKWIGKWLLCIRNPDTIETRSVWLPDMQWSCKLRCYSEWIHADSARQESSTGLAVSSHIVLACDVLIGPSA